MLNGLLLEACSKMYQLVLSDLVSHGIKDATILSCDFTTNIVRCIKFCENILRVVQT